MSDFEIRTVTESGGPQFVRIYCRGVDVTPGPSIPAYSGEAERLVEQFQRVAAALGFDDRLRPGDRCRLKDVDIVAAFTEPGQTPEIFVKRGTEGTVMKVTWTADKGGPKLMLEVDFDHGRHKIMHQPYVHRLEPQYLERVSPRHET